MIRPLRFLQYAVQDKLNILHTACVRRSLGGTFREFVLNLCRLPHGLVGPRFIESLAKADDQWVVHLRGCSTPLYFPYEDLDLLHGILSEQMIPWHWHYYQIPETRVAPGDIVVDCGAAEGIFALLTRPAARHVYCIEPLPEFQRSLQLTFRQDPAVTVVPVALGDAPGETSIPNNQGGQLRVPVDTLDALRARWNTPVHYLKGDLEGQEMPALRGARNTITECKPKIAFACYHEGQNAEEMMAFLRDCNPDYRFRLKGFSWCLGVRQPMLLHAW